MPVEEANDDGGICLTKVLLHSADSCSTGGTVSVSEDFGFLLRPACMTMDFTLSQKPLSRHCGSRSSFKVRTVSCAAERPVRSLNLDRECDHNVPKAARENLSTRLVHNYVYEV
jgi:hypothetical protein